MKKSDIMQILGSIAKLSSALRNRLISYGYSQFQINAVLVQMLLSSSAQEEQYIKLQPHKIQNQCHQIVPKQTSFHTELSKILKKQKKDMKSCFVKFLGSLQLELKSIEEYEEYCKVIQQQNSIIPTQRQIYSSQQSFKASQKSIQSDPSSQILSKFQKQSKQSSTQIQSLQSQEIRLKESLRSIIQKTKILRAMMQRQFLVNSIQEYGGFQQRRRSSFARFENFMIE